MDRRTWIALGVLALSAVLFSAGIIKKFQHAAAAQAGKRTIAVVPKGTTLTWWQVVYRGAEQAGKDFNYEIIWVGPDLETDRARQIQAVEDVITRRAQAVVLGPNDSKALARTVEEVKAAGLPCVIIDSPVDTDVYDAFVATDNHAGGAEAARLLGAALSGRGKVAVIKFVQNSASTDARAQGFADTIATEFPHIRLVAEQYTQGSVEDARQKTEDLLARLGAVDGIFAVNQPTAIGAYKAIENQKLLGKVKYIGFDSDPVLLQGIADGGITALLVQNPYEIGYQGVKLAAELLEGRPVPHQLSLPTMVVNRDNLEQMKLDYPAALGL